MSGRTAAQTVNQAVLDFDGIREAILQQRVAVPNGTATSEYARLIAMIRVGSVSGLTWSFSDIAECESIAGSVLTYCRNSVPNAIIGQAVNIDPNYYLYIY